MSNIDPNAGHQFESSIRKSLKHLGFRDVHGGRTFVVGDHQVDACGGWDDVLLVAECTQSVNVETPLLDLISEVRGKVPSLRRGFKKREEFASYSRFEWAIITKNIVHTDSEKHLADNKPKIHLIDASAIDYYLDLVPLIDKPNALRNFLGELEVTPNDMSVPRMPAFRIKLDKKVHGYLFWCQPDDLLKVAYVGRRATGMEEYYQRMLSRPRLNSIQGFIDKGGVFPNNVIVSFDKKPQFNRREQDGDNWPDWLEFGHLTFPKSYRACWIVDGQHRLYGFAKRHANPQAQKLAVVAFEQLSLHKQAKYFIEINKEQKPVSPDLIWDLEGAMAPDTPRGRIANCVKRLNYLEPLKNTITLSVPGKKSPERTLKLSGVCNDINDTGLTQKDIPIGKKIKLINPLLQSIKDEKIADRVANCLADYFVAIKEVFSPSHWEKVIMIPGGITVSLYVYQQILARLGHRPIKGDLDKYVLAFESALSEMAPNDETIIELRRYGLTSYAQRRATRDSLLSEMQDRLDDPSFANNVIVSGEKYARFAAFERKLAKFVCKKLGIEDMASLKQRASEGVWKRTESRLTQRSKENPNIQPHEVLGIGDLKEIIKRKDNAKVIMPLMTSGGGFASSTAVEGALDTITRARTPKAHSGVRSSATFAYQNLTVFERLLDT